MRQEKSVDFNVFEHVVFSENDEENPNKKLVICWWNTRPNHVGWAKQLAQWSFVKWVSCGEMDNSTLITQKNINWDMEDWCTWRSQVQGWNDSTLKLWLFWVTKPASCKGWDLGSWWLPKSGSKPVDGKMIALEEGCFIMFRRYGWMTEESYDRRDGCPKTKSLRIQKGQANGWSLFASNEVPMRHFHPFEDSETVGALAFLKSFPERVGKSTGRIEIHMFGTRFPACFPLESIHPHMPLELLRGLLKWNSSTKKNAFFFYYGSLISDRSGASSMIFIFLGTTRWYDLTSHCLVHIPYTATK